MTQFTTNAIVEVKPNIYWFAGNFRNAFQDGLATADFQLYPSYGLVQFDLTKLHVVQAPMVVNGISRSYCNLPYKGQTIELLNIDNASWIVTSTSVVGGAVTTQVSTSSSSAVVQFY